MNIKLSKLMPTAFKFFLISVSNIHLQNKIGNIFLFSIPRAGSTWLMELIASQPGFKYYDEPFNIRRENVKKLEYFLNWEVLMPEKNQDDKIISYLKKLEKNKIKVMNPPPFRRNHKFFSNRIVFKIHATEHLVNRICDELNGYIVLLLRHPIANTISRNQLPRLNLFTESQYLNELNIDEDQKKKIDEIMFKGDTFEMGILSWCLQNLALLSHEDKTKWIIITYEELLLNPEKSCTLLANKLKLPNLQKMIKSIGIPAQNITISDKSTIDLMQSDTMDKNRKLVSKWKKKVSEQQEKKAFEIIKSFGINIYTEGNFIANSEYLNFKDTKF